MKYHKDYFAANLIFVLIFLNIWDFVAARQVLNGMLLGIFLFGPVMFLWFVSTIKSIVALTLLSLIEFVVLLIPVLEGLHFGVVGLNLRSLFWVPYLVMAGINCFWGLSIYSEYREKRIKRNAKVGAQ